MKHLDSIPTTTHWFWQLGTTSTGVVDNFADAYLFRPPAAIAGKACIMRLISMTHQNHPPSAVFYLKGFSYPQNNIIDPQFSAYGAMSASTFYKLAGDDKTTIFANFHNGQNVGSPDILVQVPHGPTECILGMLSPTTFDLVLNSHFIIEFTPIE